MGEPTSTASRTLEPMDLTIKRPGTGLAPDELGAILGRRTLQPIEADTPLEAGAVA